MVGVKWPTTNRLWSPWRVLDSTKFKNQSDLPCLGKSISSRCAGPCPPASPAGGGATGQEIGSLNAILAVLYKMLGKLVLKPKTCGTESVFQTGEPFLAHYLMLKSHYHRQKRSLYPGSLCIEMDNGLNSTTGRESGISKNTTKISGKGSSSQGHRFMPFIVVIIDEFADLIMTAGRDVEGPLPGLHKWDVLPEFI